MEGQKHGFNVSGLDDGFIFARANGPRPLTASTQFPIGSYVRASGKYGRVVGISVDDNRGETYSIQFYRYSDKIVKTYAIKDLVVSKRVASAVLKRLDVGMKPDCTVEWRGRWYDAKVLRKKTDSWFVHYVGDEKSWDEWVGKDRIRFNIKPDCQVEWRGKWYGAKVLKKEDGRWFIHYVGDDDSWNEWVGKDRIRCEQKKSSR